MTRTLDAVLLSWPFDPWVVVGLLLTAAIYVRGWLVLRRRHSRWGGWRLAAFLGGMAAVFVALASPVETFSGLLLYDHMIQHLLLMMVAPPLLWLGEPLFLLLRGLPRPLRVAWAAPLLRWAALRRIFRTLTHPGVAWLPFVAATWLWHLPPAYELTLRSDGWHHLEHACFLGTALLFWYPVVRPYPSRPSWSAWLLVPYLFLVDLQNTALAALLAFSGRVLYPHYEAVPRLGGLSALEDQAVAGVVMWVPGSVAFLLPLVFVGVRLLQGNATSPTRQRGFRSPSPPRGEGREDTSLTRRVSRVSLPVVSNTPPDVLRVPLLGRFLRWKHARVAVQLPLLLLAGLIIYDGFCGPQTAPLNLAGVLPWVHWRGVLVVGLLAAGNVFCFACPFVLPRTLARRWLPAGRAWPRWLRGKWLAVGLLLLFLWAYEAFSLWDSPWLTASLVVGYFVAAFAVDAVFRGGSFCKYVCPLGQFNFAGATLSPLEVKVRDQAVCRSCTTKDCIRGRGDIPGCELHLFAPRKAGNLDCTFCLDCVHACPHDNVGVRPVTPAADLWSDPQRSGLGRLSRRPDLAVLVLVLAFGAFANAAGMVGPVVAWQERLGPSLGLTSRLAQTTAFSVLTLLVVPVLLVGGITVLSRLCGEPGRFVEVATRYAYALVPLGFAMWAAHYGYHLLTGYAGAVPVLQRFAADLGFAWFGEPAWSCCCAVVTPGWLVRLELLALGVGLLLSLYAAYRIGLRHHAARRALLAATPWALLLAGLFAAGVWIVLQPMQMRGTLMLTG